MIQILLATLLAAGAEPAPRGIAKLSLALGAVQGKGPAQADWAPLAAGADLEAGTALRTGAGIRAALDLADGGELRLDENTELTLEQPRKISIKHGRLWIRITPGEPFAVRNEYATLTSTECVADMTFTPRVPNTDQQAMTVVYVFEGKSLVASRKYTQDVTTGYWCTLLGGQLNTPDPMGDPFLPTLWLHPLLRERGPAAARETDRRVRGLLSRLARQADKDPYEAALKSLGEPSFAFLGSYLASPSNPSDLARRNAAARVMGEAATLKSAALLLPLLGNETPDVRVVAARGLARLGGGDLGRNDAYWKGEDRAAGIKAWEEWIAKNVK